MALTPPHPGTARELRYTLNRMEAGYAKDRHDFHLGIREQLDVLFEVAETQAHADDLAALLQKGRAEHAAVWRGINELSNEPAPAAPVAP